MKWFIGDECRYLDGVLRPWRPWRSYTMASNPKKHLCRREEFIAGYLRGLEWTHSFDDVQKAKIRNHLKLITDVGEDYAQAEFMGR